MRLPTPLLRRNCHAHKNTFGHVLVVAGSRNMLGAAALTGLAAMRSGAGLVTVAVPEGLNNPLQKKVSHVIMTLPVKQTREGTFSGKAFPEIKKFSERCQSLAVGPGLTQNSETQELVRQILRSIHLPTVIDADALNAVARLPRFGNRKYVLTPHPGEMARLTGRSKAWVENNRKECAISFARKHQVVLLLKGHRTVIASPDGKTYINKTGNPGMATAGSGDVLTGMIAALMGQGLEAFPAACWGAYLHGLAGDKAAARGTPASLLATDIIETIPLIFKKLITAQAQRIR